MNLYQLKPACNRSSLTRDLTAPIASKSFEGGHVDLHWSQMTICILKSFSIRSEQHSVSKKDEAQCIF